MAKKEKNEFINEELDEMYENDKSNVEDLIIIPDLESEQDDEDKEQDDKDKEQDDKDKEQDDEDKEQDDEPEMTINNDDEPEMTINNDDGTLYYEVVKGDNIYSIASMFNIDYKKLYQDNKDVIGTNMNYIEVGMMLLIDKN